MVVWIGAWLLVSARAVPLSLSGRKTDLRVPNDPEAQSSDFG